MPGKVIRGWIVPQDKASIVCEKYEVSFDDNGDMPDGNALIMADWEVNYKDADRGWLYEHLTPVFVLTFEYDELAQEVFSASKLTWCGYSSQNWGYLVVAPAKDLSAEEEEKCE